MATDETMTNRLPNSQSLGKGIRIQAPISDATRHRMAGCKAIVALHGIDRT